MTNEEVRQGVLAIESKAYRFLRTTLNMKPEITGFRTIEDYKKYINEVRKEIDAFIQKNEELEDE